MGKIVYHGTWSPQPPHEYGGTFHAGTEQAARDRLFSGENIPEGEGARQAIHAYEVSSIASIDPKLYSDPDAGDTYSNIWGNHPRKQLPEQSSRITQYLNDHEDRGSTSYVIPSEMVARGMVKHLGAQWSIDPEDQRNAPIVQATKSMLGVPQKK